MLAIKSHHMAFNNNRDKKKSTIENIRQPCFNINPNNFTF